MYTFSKFNDGCISTGDYARIQAMHTGTSVPCVGMLPSVDSFLDRQPVLPRPCRLRKGKGLRDMKCANAMGVLVDTTAWVSRCRRNVLMLIISHPCCHSAVSPADSVRRAPAPAGHHIEFFISFLLLHDKEI